MQKKMSHVTKTFYRLALLRKAESKSLCLFPNRKFRADIHISHNLDNDKPESLSKLANPTNRIFSGIQPTGSLHLGNYFGAVRQWVEHQDENSLYSIVDLHSITLPQDPKVLKANIIQMAASLIACGIDHEKCILFQQSSVPQHTQLAWVLGCLTTLPRLGQLTQFKDKSAKLNDVPLGLFIYPVLQSADILLYKATRVPVGEDQREHIQLAQHISKLFNNKFGPVFPKPSAVSYDETASRLKSLRNPDKKMSKSDPDTKSRIELTDTVDQVVDKCKKAMTDFTSAVTFDPVTRPAVANLIILHSLCSGLDPDTLCHQHRHLDTAQYKLAVAEAVNEFLQPIQRRYLDLMQDRGHLVKILDQGRDKAIIIAQKTLSEVSQVTGFSIH